MTATAPSADHLVPLEDGWSAWRVMRLRGAGFPAALVDELGMPAAARLADAHIDARTAAEAARQAALAACSELYARRTPAQRRTLGKLLRRLRAGGVPPAPPDDPDVVTALVGAHQAQAAAAASERALSEGFEADRRAVATALRRAVSSARFREAVTWQNRHALHHGLDGLAAIPVEAVDRDTRKREAAVASYLQRYCVKNDTIGFFGPVGWGTFREDLAGVHLAPGPSLLARRTVYYEHWGMNALAHRLGDDAQLLPWLRPRRSPTLRVDGATLHAPGGQRAVLAPAVARLLEACDGARRAVEIARALVADASLQIADEDEVYALLAALVDKELVTWTLELPPEALDPEGYLRAELAGVDDEVVRARCLAPLDALAAARARVAAAAGDPAALDAALGAFEDTFSALTGVPATRKAGQTYGGRTLLYEDCRRDVDFALGADVLRRIGPPLALILTGARWFTYELARRYRGALEARYTELRRERGGCVVELRELWDRARELLSGPRDGSIVSEVAAELRARWQRLLSIDPAERRCERSAAELQADAMAVFRAPGPGWPLARYQSPDLLIAADSVDAIARGDYLVVVGEVHTGMSSVLVPVFLQEYPDAETLIRAREADVPAPCIAPVWSHERSRADMFSLARHDLALETGPTRSWRPRAQVFPESAWVVEGGDRGLEVRTRDGAHRFDIIAFVEHHLIAESHAEFSITGNAAHVPRVTIDGLVVSRERWQLAPDQAPFAHLDTPLARFVGARAWARSLGLPRRVFVKVPHETKPVYVDLESAICVDHLARLVRQASSLVVSEMLPDLSQAWLTDREGRRYTSEFRIAALDPLPFTRASESGRVAAPPAHR